MKVEVIFNIWRRRTIADKLNQNKSLSLKCTDEFFLTVQIRSKLTACFVEHLTYIVTKFNTNIDRLFS